MDSAHHALIERFYRAFSERDANTMAACYADHPRFSDPVFTLEGDAVTAMWRMLLVRGKDLRVEFGNLQADAESGSADWQAWYTFSATRRPVHNRIHAQFRFEQGRIVEHVDSFDFWRWSRQALGPAGLLLGWTPMLRAKVRAQAAANLAIFQASEAARV
jgi:SnoaL-like domain